MKRNLRLFTVGVLAAAVAAMIGGTAWHAMAGPYLACKGVKWNDTLGQAVASLPNDTTFMTDEADTTRTAGINTDDWDWAAIGQSAGGVATGGWACKVYFVAPVSNAVTDSIYFTVEQGAVGTSGGVGANAVDTLFSYNPLGQVGGGSGQGVALPVGVGNSGSTGIWAAQLVVDPDTPGNTNLWMVPKFRLRVHGDVSGTTPKLSGFRCFIVYPKRQESQ